jgi:hypothetical protein
MKNFQISTDTKARLTRIMACLREEEQDTLLAFLADFATEIEMAVRKEQAEMLRQQWSDVFRTMCLKMK